MASSVPQRRCVGCGRIAEKADLLRLALAGGRPREPKVVIDERCRMPGRGAYLCLAGPKWPSHECLERALRRGALARTLRCSAKIDTSDLLESVSR